VSWRDSFLRQARSDDNVRRRLDDPLVEYSHRLHYFQMVAEKLAKGFMTGPEEAEPPRASHNAFVRLLQTVKGRPDIRRQLGYDDAVVFRAFIDSLLDLADQIERLAPSAAGFTQPNPEYPWRDPATNTIHVPAEFDFQLFDPRNPKMIKMERLLQALLRIAE
jgi:hypothetical protein